MRAQPATPSVDDLRHRMVERQLVRRGISDPLVLKAMRKVPRHLFVSQTMAQFAYEDTPLPIGSRQTISQPYIVALMTEALGLKGGERVLEIGTGSGYAAAVMAEIVAKVYTIERIEDLAAHARVTLNSLGYDNVEVICGDGSLGWLDAAPYDGIVVTAGGPEVPPALKTQLAVGGRLVIPVEAEDDFQELLRLTRSGGHTYGTVDLGDVRFVPLIGEQGWHSGRKNDGDPALW